MQAWSYWLESSNFQLSEIGEAETPSGSGTQCDASDWNWNNEESKLESSGEKRSGTSSLCQNLRCGGDNELCASKRPKII